MALLEEFLKYSKTHGPTVIVVLVGVILIGSVGGGFWIQGLNSTLTQKDALIAQRLDLVEERYRNRYSELHSQYGALRERTKALASQVTIHRRAVLSLSEELTQMSETVGLNPSIRQGLLDASNDLRNGAERLSLDVGTTATDVDRAMGGIRFAEEYGHPKAAAPTWLPWVLVVLVVVLVVVVVLLRRRSA